MRLNRGLASLAVLTLAVTLSGQTPKPTFDVASVKVQLTPLEPALLSRAVPRMRGRGVFGGTHATVESLILFAYDLQPAQAIGGPDWIRRDWFEIDARAAVDASPAQIKFMVQSLLEDRFKLVTRTEQREMRYLELVLARPDGRLGPDLHRLKEGACYGKSVGEVLREAFPVRLLPSARSRLAGACLRFREVATLIGALLETIVIDKTNLDGEWVFDAPFGAVPRLDSARLGAPLVEQGAAAASALPPFTVALEERLGLKLESARGPVEVHVIDSIQQPTEN